jgi:hypothetical protein
LRADFGSIERLLPTDVWEAPRGCHDAGLLI